MTAVLIWKLTTKHYTLISLSEAQQTYLYKNFNTSKARQNAFCKYLSSTFFLDSQRFEVCRHDKHAHITVGFLRGKPASVILCILTLFQTDSPAAFSSCRNSGNLAITDSSGARHNGWPGALHLNKPVDWALHHYIHWAWFYYLQRGGEGTHHPNISGACTGLFSLPHLFYYFKCKLAQTGLDAED